MSPSHSSRRPRPQAAAGGRVVVPDTPAVITRGRLVDQLGRTDVTVVTGPAGYGKTTLLADWARRSRPAAWLTLSAADTDPVRLMIDLTAALRLSCVPSLTTPGIEIRTPYDGLEPPSSSVSLETYIAMLHDRLAAAGRPTAIVLDDVHAVAGARRSLSLLDAFVQTMPAGVRVLLAARQVPRLRIARLHLAGRLTVIGAEDLAFTAAETAIVITPPGTRPDGRRVDAVQQATQGWPVAVRMCAIASSGSKDIDAAGAESGASLTDYLVTEVLDAIDPDLRSLIVDSCLDDVVCADLVDTVRVREDSAELLERCYRAGHFLTAEHAAGSGTVWYTWHQTFLTHVQRTAERENGARVRALHAGAATWWRHLDPVRAVDHALKAGRPELGAELAADTWPELVLAGQTSTVLTLVEHLPPGLEYEAELTLSAALSEALRGDGVRARHLLLQACKAADRLPAPARLRFDARAEAVSLRYLVTDLESLQECVDRGHRLLQELEDGAWVPDPVTLLITRLCVGMGEARLQRDNQAALRLLRLAAEVARDRGLTAVYLSAVAETCIPTIATGALDVAATSAEMVLTAAAAKGWGVPSSLAPAVGYTGWLSFWRGDLDHSITQLRQAKQALSDSDSDAAFRGLTSYFLAQAFLYCGRTGDGRKELDEMALLGSRGLVAPYWPSILAAVEAELLLAEGHSARAHEQATRTVGGQQYRLALTARARVLLRTGDATAALDVLDEVAVEERFVNVTVLVQRLRAEALYRLERYTEAQYALEVALAAAEPFGLVLPFLVDGDAMRPILRAHVADTRWPALTRSILARLAETEGPIFGVALTPRELAVLRHLASSMTLVEIAEAQGVSVNTIKSQAASLYRKLEARGRRQAVRIALDRNVL